MNAASVVRLILLSAIWGGSFLFMRVGAPVLGPALLIFLRVALGAVFLAIVGAYLKKPLEARQHWRHYLAIGFLNSTLPFFLLAFAAQTISASLGSILNATTPIWGALLTAVWTRTALKRKAVLGLLLGIAGTVLLAGVEALSLPAGGVLAILAALGAAFSYGLVTVYARTAKSVEPVANAQGNMWAATLMLAPALLVAPIPASLPALPIVEAVVGLGVLCSGVAYLLYFRLIADIGATRTLTVTFLIPVFGVLWGYLFLDEAVGWHTFVGAAIVLAGTVLVTDFSLAALLPRRERTAA